MWRFELLYVMVVLVMGLIHYWVYKWRNPKCSRRLPPGSMGLPLIGETLQFLVPSKSIDGLPFFKIRTMKYGRIFKTSLAGRPVVVSSDPEFNYCILQQEGKLVGIWYLHSFARLLDARTKGRHGESAPVAPISHIHKCVRNAIMNLVGREALRERILPDMEEISRKTLLAWSSRDSLDVKKEITLVLYGFLAKILFGFEPEKNMSASERSSFNLRGLVSFLLSIPGTSFNKILKNHNMVIKMMKHLIDERRAMPEKCRADLIDEILDMMKTESFISDEFATFAMFVILFASFETISSTLTVAIMLLTKHPMVIKELEREHEEILRSREDREGGVTWKEYKSMNFTMQDLGPTFKAKNFIPFGGGARMCAGAEFTKAFMAVFLHILVSNYRLVLYLVRTNRAGSSQAEGITLVTNPVYPVHELKVFENVELKALTKNFAYELSACRDRVYRGWLNEKKFEIAVQFVGVVERIPPTEELGK
ncbi:hypothetical protein CRG98_006529 [Punica granatum]|uniref:Cytochrome P450 87A3-like n=1 Tax=Punica granatum TaxID=22663 RepID=A0A2I0KX84_PUNGR|nr:hypothetical protein CRG98_006529 [Punica granatum]